MIEGRLQPVLAALNMNSFTEYYHYVVKDKSGEALINLLNKLTTNHTYFMRESDHFQFFRDTVLPYWSAAAKNKDLRIWSAGCSTGEEPYTLAMILQDFFADKKWLWDTRVLATDISRKVLETASEGVYFRAGGCTS